jgi:Flp pilus assembly protein TadD
MGDKWGYESRNKTDNRGPGASISVGSMNTRNITRSTTWRIPLNYCGRCGDLFVTSKKERLLMSSRATSFVVVLATLFLGSPLLVGCGLQSIITEKLLNPESDSSSDDSVARNGVGDYENVIENNLQDADAYNDLCARKYDLKDYRGAIANCNKAIMINPRHSAAYYNRANAKGELSDIEGAMADYGTAIEINPKDFAAYTNRGGIKYESKDFDGAISDFSKAVEINPNNANAFSNRCNSKIELEDYAGAIADCSMAIKINPKQANAYNNRGQAKYALGARNGACDDMKKAASLGIKTTAQWLNSESGDWCRYNQ